MMNGTRYSTLSASFKCTPKKSMVQGSHQLKTPPVGYYRTELKQVKGTSTVKYKDPTNHPRFKSEAINVVKDG